MDYAIMWCLIGFFIGGAAGLSLRSNCNCKEDDADEKQWKYYGD